MTHQPPTVAEQVGEFVQVGRDMLQTIEKLNAHVAWVAQVHAQITDMMTRVENTVDSLKTQVDDLKQEFADEAVQDDILKSIFTRLDAIEDVIMELHPEVKLTGDEAQEEPKPGQEARPGIGGATKGNGKVDDLAEHEHGRLKQLLDPFEANVGPRPGRVEDDVQEVKTDLCEAGVEEGDTARGVA